MQMGGSSSNDSGFTGSKGSSWMAWMPPAPLPLTGVNFSNATDAFNYLQDILDDTYLQLYGNHAATHFWYGIVVFIGVAAILNITFRLVRFARLRASRSGHASPARPTGRISRVYATATAITREIAYLQLTPARWSFWFKVPPVGHILILLAYFAFILALQFINDSVSGGQHYQKISVRAAWLAVAQVPLVVLLAAKNNLIGRIVGSSYERLNVYHRWIARGMLLLATFHFGFESYGWNRLGLMQLEWATDTCPPTGIAAYALLLWLNLSTLAPLRHLSYDLFVTQHLISFFGFIIAIMIHIPTTATYARVYIYVPIGLFLADRLLRTLRFAWLNFRPARATLEALNGQAVRIRITGHHLHHWAPGSHVLLSIPRFGLAQSHPVTIMSTPTSHNGDLVCILRSFHGFTNRLLRAAEAQDSPAPSHVALLDGTYGACHADMASFDTVMLVAGGTGVTFTLSVLLGLVCRSSERKLPLRTIRFIWVIKKHCWLSWIAEELKTASEKFGAVGIELQCHIYITCDDSLTNERLGSQPPGGDNTCTCQGKCECGSAGEKSDMQPVARNVVRDRSAVCENLEEGVLGSASLSSSQLVFIGRPQLKKDVWDILENADGEAAVASCGPLALTTDLRSAIVRLSDERAIHKGTGAQGVYLHIETFH